MTRGCSPIGLQTEKASQQTTTHGDLNIQLGQMVGQRSLGRRSKKRFLYVPVEVLTSEACRTLPPSALKVLCCIAAQYGGHSNGDMCVARKVLVKFGFSSRRQVFAATKRLEERGLIIKTRQGGRNKCNLYAVTWLAIDYCKGKLDVPETRVPSNAWKKWSASKLD